MTEDELLEAIRADPDNDGPRLVYADWLQERGDPMGECIVLLIEQEKVSADEPRTPALLARIREFESLWDDPIWNGRSLKYERGLPSRLVLRDEYLDAELTHRLRRTLIRDLEILRPLDAAKLAGLKRALPSMCLRRLRLEHAVPASMLEELLASPALGRLEELQIGPAVIDDACAQVLAAAPLPKLARLKVLGHPQTPDGIGDAGAKAIATSPALPSLQEISLIHQNIGPDGAGAFLAKTGPRGLLALDLSGNPLGDRALSLFLEGERTPALTSLALAGLELDTDDAHAIASAPCLAGIRCLRLAIYEGVTLESGLRPEDVDVLVASKVLPPRMRLEIDGVALDLKEDVSIDGVNGQPCWWGWKGEPRKDVADRFEVVVIGLPILDRPSRS